jgi:histone acetyltransferase (RNA polymerase elongator complex component)
MQDALRRLSGLLQGLPENSDEAPELAFYGGTFTALPGDWTWKFAEAAAGAKAAGRISRLRCSTRPDAVDAELLARLRGLGMDMVELGVQSFDTGVLDASGRGYGDASALRACQAVKASGLELGIQLLPGLPGMDEGIFERDARTAAELEPDCARLYPCVVIEGSGLAEMWRSGAYAPWELGETVRRLGSALLEFWRRSVPVIRIGLAPEQELLEGILAGPWHPAMGQMAAARALFLFIREKITELGYRPQKLVVPERWASDFKGHGRGMLEVYEALGLPLAKVEFREGERFILG